MIDDPGLDGIPAHAEALGVPARVPRRTMLDDGSGLRLGALDWTDGAPHAVLLHGGSQNAHTWNGAVLLSGVAALAVDLPGHGHSEWYPDGRYAPARMADSIATALRPVLVEPVVLVGHSLSGVLSPLVAERLGDLVRGVVIVDAEPSGIRAVGPLVTYQGSFDDLVAAVTPRHGGDRTALERGVRANAVRTVGDDWRWRWDPRVRASQPLWAAEEGDVRRAAAGLRMPVLGIRGEFSRPLDPVAHRDFLATLADARVAVAPGAGHNVHSDATAWFADVLRDVVAGRVVGDRIGGGDR